MRYVLAVVILIFTATIAHAQVTDSSKQKPASVQADTTTAGLGEAATYNDDDFTVFLIYFGFVACGVIVIGIGLGIAITIGLLFLIAAMVAAGIISASVIVGIYTRSLTKGFKVFFISSSTVAGGLFGAVGLWVLNLSTHWHDTLNAILLGAGCGLVSGLAGGMISFYFLQRLVARLRSKITIPIIPK